MRTLFVAPLVIALLVAGGCATPARVEGMSVAASEVGIATAPPALRGNVAIHDVTGGKETNPMWMSSVGSAEFQQALEASLRAVGMLAQTRMSGKYTLVAHLEHLEQPLVGASLTVTATIQYVVSERASGKIVFATKVTEPYTAAFSDAFLGVERLGLANEGAIKANIAKFISQLAGQKLASIEISNVATRSTR